MAVVKEKGEDGDEDEGKVEGTAWCELARTSLGGVPCRRLWLALR